MLGKKNLADELLWAFLQQFHYKQKYLIERQQGKRT